MYLKVHRSEQVHQNVAVGAREDRTFFGRVL
jgi:hypothetical protein